MKGEWANEHPALSQLLNNQRFSQGMWAINEPPDEKLSWSEKTKKKLETDNQLRETITLINIYHLGLTCNSHAMATRKGALDFMNKIHVSNKPLNLIEVKN